MSGITLNELEYSFFATRSGLTSATATVGDHKRAYFVSKGISGGTKTLGQMEREWLRTVAGTSGSGSNYLGDLWREACVEQSVTVGATMNECKRNFYTLATGNP